MVMGKNRQQRRAEARALDKIQKGTVPAPVSDIPILPSNPPWIERWRNGIRAGESAVVIGLWATGITAADMMFVIILLLVGLAIGLIAIAADPIRSVQKKVILGIILSVTMIGTASIAFYRHEEPIPTALLASQIDEMRDIEQFLTKSQDTPPTFGDSEENIRRAFDLNGLVSNNVRFVIKQIDPSRISKSISDDLDVYFSDSIFLMDMRYITTSVDPISKAYNFSFVSGKIGGIKLPKKYLYAVNKLKQFELSIQLPKELIEDIKDLDITLSDNMNILTETINSQLQKNQEYVLGDQDNHSPYLGATTNLYWSKFIPLKPKVDKIINSIKSYLRIGK